MKKRFMALALAGVLSCGLVACGGSGSSSSESSKSTSNVSSESAVKSNQNPAVFGS